MNTELRVCLHEQMRMVGHDFHLYDLDMKFAANSLYESLQSHIDIIDQDLTAEFWTAGDMIFGGVHPMMIAFKFQKKQDAANAYRI